MDEGVKQYRKGYMRNAHESFQKALQAYPDNKKAERYLFKTTDLIEALDKKKTIKNVK